MNPSYLQTQCHEDNIATFSRQLEINHGPFRHNSTILHMLKQLLSRARNPLDYLLLQVGSVAALDPSTRASLLLFLYRRRRFYFTALISLIITGSLSAHALPIISRFLVLFFNLTNMHFIFLSALLDTLDLDNSYQQEHFYRLCISLS